MIIDRVYASGRARKERRYRGDPRQFPEDSSHVETHASITQHRKQMKEDAANREAGKVRHVPIVKAAHTGMIASLSAIVATVIVFATESHASD